MIGAVIGAILGTLGIAAASEVVRDIVNGIGVFASKKWRDFVNKVQKVINENSQMLSDFKTKSESQKAYIINSLLSSSGLGARAESLRSDLAKLNQKEKNLTDEVTEKNSQAAASLTDAERRISNAQTGLIGAVEAVRQKPTDTSTFKVNDPSQNVNGGLNERN